MGPIAVVIAVAGTILPIALGTGYMVAAGYDPETGVAAGTSLSSTSIGMATAMMSRVGELNTPLGSLICVAAMVDDVLSLVILAVIGTLGTGADSGAASAVAARVARPVLVSLAVVLLGRLAFAIVPTLVDAVERRIEPEHRRDAILVTMLVLTLGLTFASGAAGSTFLLGAFAGGFAFAKVERARDAWRPRRPSRGFTAVSGRLNDGTRRFLRGRHANPAHARVQRARVRARRGVRRPRGGG